MSSLKHHVCLKLTGGPYCGQSFDFDKPGTVVIGRAVNADIRLPADQSMQSFHVRLQIDPPEAHLLDLCRLPMTSVNGAKVKQAKLRNGDRIQCGDTQFEFVAKAGNPLDDRTVADKPEAATHADDALEATTLDMIVALENEIAGYAILREVGKGGMGVVYEAVQQATGQHVALKVIMPDMVATERGIPMFLREAEALRQLDHPRIVRFYDCGKAGVERVFLAMEFVDTVDLTTILEGKAQDSQTRTKCGVVCQMLEALDYAHSKGLVHRDIKPSNMLIARSGKRLRTKVADFGLAKSYLDDTRTLLTNLGEVRGTLPFMAPEQLIDCRFVKPAADIYSAGATLYFLLSNALPYENCRPDSRNTDADLVPLQSRVPGCSPGLAAVVHRALKRDPAGRFSSAKAMRQALLPFAQRKQGKSRR